MAKNESKIFPAPTNLRTRPVHAWKLIVDGPLDGTTNMDRDSALLESHRQSSTLPALRLYSWRSPTLSVGYSQNVADEIDESRCLELNVPIVRRPTGGRAVFHFHELTYSVTAPIPHPQFPNNLKGTHAVISQALLKGLELFGVPAQVAPKARGMGKPSLRSPICFNALNHGEIVVENRKLVGSAQRRKKYGFLQHGSIVIDADHSLQNSLFLFDTPEVKQKNLELLERSTTTLNQVLQKKFDDLEALQRCLCRGFEEVLNIVWETPSSPY